MNREILFRGKRKDNNEWFHGFYWTNGLGNHFIRVIKEEEDNFLKFIIEDLEVIGNIHDNPELLDSKEVE